MEIPAYALTGQELEDIELLWKKTAAQISMEEGLFIQSMIRYPPYYQNRVIYFLWNKQEFYGLNSLKRALKLKAFM